MSQKIDELISKLDTSSDKIAESVITQLVKIGSQAVPKLLNAATKESKPRIRKWSLQALGAIGDRKAGSLLIKALDDKRMTVKLHAIRGLSRMNYRRAAKDISRMIKDISRMIKDTSGGIRVNAIDALVCLRAKSVGAILVQSLQDQQWYVRQHAAKACEELNIKQAVTKLKKLQKTETRKAVLDAVTHALLKLS